MNKKELSKMPRPSVTKKHRDILKTVNGIRSITSAKRIEIDGKDTLVINYFKIKRKKIYPAFRVFCQDDDYISQDLTTDKTKWKTGGWDHLTDQYYCYGGLGWNRATALLSSADGEIIISWCKKWLKDNKVKIPDAKKAFFGDYIFAYQDTIRRRRLDVKQRRRMAVIDEKMELFGDIPEDYPEFVEKTVLDDVNYFFYSKKDKKAYCTRCGHEFEIRKDGVYHKTIGIWNDRDQLHHNRDFMCPYCNKYTEAKSEGMSRSGLYHARWSILVQTADDKVLTRYFCHTKDFRKNYKKPIIKSWEALRTLHSADKVEDFEYTTSTYTHKIRWCPPRGRGWNWNPTEFTWPRAAVLYNKDFGILKDTCMKYSCIDIFLDKVYPKINYPDSFFIDRYLNFYREYPFIEQMLKIGWYNIPRELMAHHVENSGITNGRSVCESCGITREQFLLLKNARNGDPYLDDLKIVKKAALRGLRLSVKDIQDLYIIHITKINGDIDGFLDMMQYMTLHKLIRYLDSQRIIHAADYFDYIGWIKEMDCDLKSDFNLFPKDFYSRHDQAAEAYRDYKDKEVREKLKEFNELLAKEGSKAVIDPKAMKIAGLFIRLPYKVEELKTEGEILHHCVGTYINRVIEGQTTIFFIRKLSDPDKPFYTLEWKNNKVIQCRGRNNKDMTPEVKAFVKIFEEQMHKAAVAS